MTSFNNSVVILLSISILSSCQAPSQEAKDSPDIFTSPEVRPATRREICQILTNRDHPFGSGAADGGQETFLPDGRYLVSSILNIEGRYRLYNNIVCTSRTMEGALDYCRAFFIGPDGPRTFRMKSSEENQASNISSEDFEDEPSVCT